MGATWKPVLKLQLGRTLFFCRRPNISQKCGCFTLTTRNNSSVNNETNGNGGNIDKKIQNNLIEIRKGNFGIISHPEGLKHFKQARESQDENMASSKQASASGSLDNNNKFENYTLPHPIWDAKELEDIHITHKTPEGLVDRLAYMSVKMMRWSFDVMSGYNRGVRNEKVWLNRICFLETVAGVPGMVAAMTRHLHSLRRLRRDHGWIHTLLEEAENERMHLMTAMQLKKPSWLFRTGVIVTQGVFVTGFSVVYLLSPRFCHRFVGYLEEEAVVTYTKCLKDIHDGPMQHWQTQKAPAIAISYWHLKSDATMVDVIRAIRADEAHHRVVNHTLASMKEDDFNPYKPGE